MRRNALAASLAVLSIAALPAGVGRAVAEPSAVSIRINLPAYRLTVTTPDTVVSYRIAIGTPRYPTPRGTFAADQLVWNPRWVPPASDWARDERPQPPGPANNMGRVKLRVTGLVFVHGTPYLQSLGTAASHACMRMANADVVALARLIHPYVLPEVPPALVDSLDAEPGRTRTFAIPVPVPVDVRYELAEVAGDSLWIYPNVYSLPYQARQHAMAALWNAGVDTVHIDAGRVARLARDARRRARGAPIAELLLRADGA